jgi:hypothetical protein
VLEEEVDVVHARGTAVGTIRISSGQKQIHSNQVPTRPNGAGRGVGDEEKPVGAGSDHGFERSRANRGGRGRWWLTINCGKGIHRSERRKGANIQGIREYVGLNGASWVAGAISWLGIFVEPNLVILLNMQVLFQWVGKRGVAMVQVSEIRAVNRVAWQDSGRNG